MKLSAEQFQIAQDCATAEELVEKAASSGFTLSIEKAQTILDSTTMVELKEEDLNSIAGGGCGGSAQVLL